MSMRSNQSINVLFWNAQTLTTEKLTSLITLHHYDIYCISEAKISLNTLLLIHDTNLSYIENTDKSLLIIYKPSFKISEILLDLSYTIHVKLLTRGFSFSILLTHLANDTSLIHPQLSEIRKHLKHSHNSPLILGGDFNFTTSQTDSSKQHIHYPDIVKHHQKLLSYFNLIDSYQHTFPLLQTYTHFQSQEQLIQSDYASRRIDRIYTNTHFINPRIIPCPTLSDHAFTSLSIYSPQSTQKTSTAHLLSKRLYFSDTNHHVNDIIPQHSLLLIPEIQSLIRKYSHTNPPAPHTRISHFLMAVFELRQIDPPVAISHIKSYESYFETCISPSGKYTLTEIIAEKRRVQECFFFRESETLSLFSPMHTVARSLSKTLFPKKTPFRQSRTCQHTLK